MERFISSLSAGTARFSAVLGALALCLAGVATTASAQDENTRATKEAGVRITLLPPPMEGTLSLGIYGKGGKLVRTLRAEANPEKDFSVGQNGLSVTWDGRDDAGQPAAPGKYQARGFAVGALDLSGEAILGNDWYDGDESPRVASIVSLDGTQGEWLLLTALLADGARAQLQCDRLGRLSRRDPAQIPAGPPFAGPPSAGRDGSTWVIEPGESGQPEVTQYSKSKELLRHLATTPGEPLPKQVAASSTDEVIFVLEEKAGEQRLRGLALKAVAAEQALSTWTTFVSKRIVASPDFASAKGEFKNATAFKPVQKLTVQLVPNPLFKETTTGADLQIAIDEHGSFLRTLDGLRLSDLTDTPHLKWLVFGHEGASRAITFLQSDGAVVEQFRIRRPANLMAFDAGEYELKR